MKNKMWWIIGVIAVVIFAYYNQQPEMFASYAINNLVSGKAYNFDDGLKNTYSNPEKMSGSDSTNIKIVLDWSKTQGIMRTGILFKNEYPTVFNKVEFTRMENGVDSNLYLETKSNPLKYGTFILSGYDSKGKKLSNVKVYVRIVTPSVTAWNFDDGLANTMSQREYMKSCDATNMKIRSNYPVTFTKYDTSIFKKIEVRTETSVPNMPGYKNYNVYIETKCPLKFSGTSKLVTLQGTPTQAKLYLKVSK